MRPSAFHPWSFHPTQNKQARANDFAGRGDRRRSSTPRSRTTACTTTRSSTTRPPSSSSRAPAVWAPYRRSSQAPTHTPHTTHHTPPPYRPGMRHSSLLVGVALIIPAWPGCGTKNVAGLGLPGPQPAGLAQLVGAGPGPQPKPHRGRPNSWAKRRPLIGVLSS